jgi:hypothetical protein
MSEVEGTTQHAFVVKVQNDQTDNVYAAADLLENAVVFAAALYVASTAVQYRPHIQVIEHATGNLAAFIGPYEEAPA